MSENTTESERLINEDNVKEAIEETLIAMNMVHDGWRTSKEDKADKFIENTFNRLEAKRSSKGLGESRPIN